MFAGSCGSLAKNLARWLYVLLPATAVLYNSLSRYLICVRMQRERNLCVYCFQINTRALQFDRVVCSLLLVFIVYVDLLRIDVFLRLITE